MRHSLCVAASTLLSCATPALAADIHVQDPVPFAESAYIADNIKAECRIGAQLASALGAKAPVHGNRILFDTAPMTRDSGRVLQLELVDAQSAGNAFAGHFKSATARGVLL